ncbi:MAG TPA: SH3 domain-containing protein, partial [Candidatus Cloacimonadota bacterium]|nr:SH3 domain-containing protein [Candidatus Cloacimonadota bacterium]
DKDLYPQRLFLVRVFFAAYDFMNVNRMAILCLVLLLLASLSLHWLMHYDPEKERAFPELISGIAVVLFIVSGIFLGIKAYRQAFNNKAVVIADTAELRSEADQSASRLALIHEALVLNVEKTRGEWCLVRTPDGNTGWLPAADLARVLAKAEE